MALHPKIPHGHIEIYKEKMKQNLKRTTDTDGTEILDNLVLQYFKGKFLFQY